MIQVTVDTFEPYDTMPDFVLGMWSAKIRQKDLAGIISYLQSLDEWCDVSLPYTICSGVKWNYIQLSYRRQ